MHLRIMKLLKYLSKSIMDNKSNSVPHVLFPALWAETSRIQICNCQQEVEAAVGRSLFDKGNQDNLEEIQAETIQLYYFSCRYTSLK